MASCAWSRAGAAKGTLGQQGPRALRPRGCVALPCQLPLQRGGRLPESSPAGSAGEAGQAAALTGKSKRPWTGRKGPSSSSPSSAAQSQGVSGNSASSSCVRPKRQTATRPRQTENLQSSPKLCHNPSSSRCGTR